MAPTDRPAAMACRKFSTICAVMPRSSPHASPVRPGTPAAAAAVLHSAATRPASASSSRPSTHASISARARRPDHGCGRSTEACADLIAGGRHHVVEPIHDERAVGETDAHLRTLGRRKALREGLVLLQRRQRDEAQDAGIGETLVVLLGNGLALQGGGHPELDAHLGLQRALERPGEVAARIAHRGGRNAHQNGARVGEVVAQAARHMQRGLTGRLREIAGRHRLVVDAQDLRLPVREQGDTVRRRLAAERREQAGLALQDVLRGVGAQLRKLHRRHRIARGEGRMEVHLAAAGVRPLVQPARGIGSDRHGRGGRTIIEPQQRGRRRVPPPAGLTNPVGRYSRARSAVISARPMRPPAS